MRQLDHFSVLQSSTEGIDTEFKSPRGYLVFGIEDCTHAVVGTNFDLQAITCCATLEKVFSQLPFAHK